MLTGPLARRYYCRDGRVCLPAVSPQVMDGAALAKLIERMVGALNSRDIPTAGSILEGFNKDLVYT